MLCCGGKTRETFTCEVVMLDGTTINFLKNENIKPSTKASVIMNIVCQNLNLLEKDYFGLKYIDDQSRQHWLDLNQSLNADPHFMKVTSQAPCTLLFGVKYYTADPCGELKEEVTRYQFFLQLKQDMLSGKLTCSWNRSAELSALALQSEIGDYSPSEHKRGYVSEFRFIPHQDREFEAEVSRLHATYSGLVPSSAEFQYLKRCRQVDMYGVELYNVKDIKLTGYQLGISPRGVETFRNKRRVTIFYWPQLKQVNHRENNLELKVQSKKGEVTSHRYQASTPIICKHIYTNITDHHIFYQLPSQSHAWNKKHRYSGRTEAEQSEMERDEPEVVRLCSKRYPPRNQQHPANNFEQNAQSDVENVDPSAPRLDETQTTLVATTPSDKQTSNKWEDALEKSSMFHVNEKEENKSVKYMTPSSERKERQRKLQTLSDNESRQHRRHKSRTGRSSGEESDSPSKRRIKANKARRNRGGGGGGDMSSGHQQQQQHRRRSNHYYTDTEMFNYPQAVVVGSHGNHGSSTTRLDEGKRNRRPQHHHHHHHQPQHHSSHGGGSLYADQSEARTRRIRRLSREDELARQQLWQHIRKDIIDPHASMEYIQNDIPYTEVRTSGNPNPRRSHPKRRSSNKRSSAILTTRSQYGESNERLNDSDGDGMVAPLQITTTVGIDRQQNHMTAINKQENHHHSAHYRAGWDTKAATGGLSDYSATGSTGQPRSRGHRKKNTRSTPKAVRRSDNVVYTQI